MLPILAAGLLAVLGAVAYGATRSGSPHPVAEPRSSLPRPPRPRIVSHPEKTAVSVTATFALAARGAKPRFECRLDAGGWRACRTPIEFSGLSAGAHAFAARTVDRRGRHSPPARFRWNLLEPKAFSISPQPVDLDGLYPGAPPLQLPVVLANPNPVAIFVTRLSVAVPAGPGECPSAANLLLGGSSASSAAPLEIPANGSVALPRPGASAPTIQLRELPVDQDACQGASFPLAFSGSARG
jgi:hypothetical protein